MTALWRFSKTQYNRVLRAAGTALAVRLMLLFAVLESIIIPIPVDPLLIATVLARPKNWIKLVAACTSASVIGGGLGWAIGVWLGVGVEQLLVCLPHAVAAPEKFTAVQDGFLEWGILLVFIGAFSPLPYKVIAVSAGVAGFGLAPFLITSLIGRGLRFAIVAGITRHHGEPRIVIILISALVTLIGGALWLVQ
ncbi:MAG: YqaA family protein [Candidatus Puniceispirillaceae bacterium]